MADRLGTRLRVYLAFDGPRLVLLLGGGTKRRQSSDIKLALACWADYRRRKRDGE